MVRGLSLAVGLLAALGCAPRARLGEVPWVPADPAPLVALLEAYNRGPEGVRVAGRLRGAGWGSADFGGRVRAGAGARLDAVAGPFSTPLFALACRHGEGCLLYLPSRRTVYGLGGQEADHWFDALLRGRVPELGPAAEARRFADGRQVLRLAGVGAWEQEVEFGAGGTVPTRATWRQDGRLAAEVSYAGHFPVGGHPFPAAVGVRFAEGDASYRLEFHTVALELDREDSLFALAVPLGTAFEPLRGLTTWHETGIPLLLPKPGR